MINEAKLEYPSHNFKVLDMTNLDKLDKKYDFIFFIASFHHLKNQEERQGVLQKTLKLINKGGFIFMTNWNLLSEINSKRYQEITK
ncbi:TPA: hypothetical protein DEG21_02680 [Patescibacteria group bacterium]|nr:hypothetical protein [Candidatus Gracilibacteria bacterium]HBY74780.1 hypothetical protein [Candidatus Gracilibacteria bacterium]